MSDRKTWLKYDGHQRFSFYMRMSYILSIGARQSQSERNTVVVPSRSRCTFYAGNAATWACPQSCSQWGHSAQCAFPMGRQMSTRADHEPGLTSDQGPNLSRLSRGFLPAYSYRIDQKCGSKKGKHDGSFTACGTPEKARQGNPQNMARQSPKGAAESGTKQRPDFGRRREAGKRGCPQSTRSAERAKKCAATAPRA